MLFQLPPYLVHHIAFQPQHLKPHPALCFCISLDIAIYCLYLPCDSYYSSYLFSHSSYCRAKYLIQCFMFYSPFERPELHTENFFYYIIYKIKYSQDFLVNKKILYQFDDIVTFLKILLKEEEIFFHKIGKRYKIGGILTVFERVVGKFCWKITNLLYILIMLQISNISLFLLHDKIKV